jgi:CelD/BcsL family acetyltransferase involved in cellulose biosynthesis
MQDIVLAKEPNFDFRSPEYAQLYAASAATAFQSPLWLGGLHRIVAPDLGGEPLTITGRLNGGRLVFVAPLLRRRSFPLCWVEFADFGLCDDQRLVYGPEALALLPRDPALPRRVAELLCPCDYVSLEKLVGDDPLLDALFPDARRAPMRISTYPAALGPDWTSWRSHHVARNFARYLDRKRRRLNRAGRASFRLVRDEAELVRVFEHVRRFRADRFRELRAPDVTERDSIFNFYRNAAIEGALSNLAWTFCLYLEDEPVSIIFGLNDGHSFSLILAAFDVRRHRGASVGLLAAEDSMRFCIEKGLSVYDFTIGDHPYKSQFGATTRTMLELHVSQTAKGRLGIAWLGFVREAKRRLAPLVREQAAWGRRAMPAQ